MEENQAYLTPAVLAVVLLMHTGLLALAWHIRPHAALPAAESIQFVDLSGWNSGSSTVSEADSTPATPQPALPPPEPVKKEREIPKPVPKETPKLHSEVRDKRADTRLPDTPTDKPVPKPPEAKAEKTPESPRPNTDTPAAPAKTPAAADSTGKGGGDKTGESKGGGDKAGDGKGSGDKAGDGKEGGGNDGRPDQKALGRMNAPPYPPQALENNEQGRVTLKVLVAAGGKVKKVTVVKSSGSRTLDNAAVRQAYKGSYQAARETEFTGHMDFSLQ